MDMDELEDTLANERSVLHAMGRARTATKKSAKSAVHEKIKSLEAEIARRKMAGAGGMAL